MWRCASHSSEPVPTCCPQAHLHDGSAGPITVLPELFLTSGRAEFQQLLTLQRVWRETSQELKEGTAGHAGNVQVLGHKVPHSAGLRQPWWVRDTCRNGMEAWWVGSLGGTLDLRASAPSILTWLPWLKCEKLTGVQAQHLAELLGVGL